MLEIPEHIELLMAKTLDGPLSKEEKNQLDNWLAESDEHRAVYEANQTIWNNTKVPNAELAWEKVSNQLGIKEESQESQNGKVLNFRAWLSRAAVIAVLCLLGYITLQLLNPNPELKEIYAESGMQKVSLADNSLVSLNQGSKLSYPEEFDADSRKVKLEGEAFFEIERMPEKPFIIDASAVDVTVLGTSFFVQSPQEGKEVKVGVKTGKVAVRSKQSGEEHILEAGDQIRYDVNSASFIIQAFETNKLFWQDSTLLYNQQSLNLVFDDLAKQFNVPINYQKADFENCLFTGRFRYNQLFQILEQMSLSYGFKFERTEEGFELKGKAECLD